MKTTRLPETNCPACGARFSAATATFGDFVPKPGDWTLCIDCGVVLAFDQTLVPRALTEAEQREADADPRVRKAQRAHRMVRENRGKGHDYTSRRSRPN